MIIHSLYRKERKVKSFLLRFIFLYLLLFKKQQALAKTKRRGVKKWHINGREH
nr:hypothetical protein [Alkalicoccobacillus plakortidis]